MRTRKDASALVPGYGREIRADIPEPPSRIARLPVDQRGYPVPWFVAYVDGVPDFRVIGEGKIEDAIRLKVCWICGQPLGANTAYVIGPMCVVNRISSEPPSHRDCALYSAAACPFLTRPHMRRRENDIPTGVTDAPGVALKHNPGLAVVWVTRGRTRPMRIDHGYLFSVPDPDHVFWVKEGQNATRQEVLDAIELGLPALAAEAEKQGEIAEAKLERQVAIAVSFAPPE